MPLDDYGAIMRSGMSLVPDYNQQIAERVGLEAKKAEIAQANAQTAEATDKQARAKQFQIDLQGVSANPDAKAVSGLIMKYPEFADHLKQGWDVKDKAAQTADLTQASEIYSAAASGHWDLALKQAQARLEADKAAGQADPNDQAMIDQIESAAGGDEKAKKSVLTMLGLHLASQAGPEHFATTYGALKGGYTLDAGAARYDDNGQLVAHSPFINDKDGNVRLWTDDGSGAPPPADGAPTSSTPAAGGGFDNAVAHVLKHEGSAYVPHDMNGAPVKYGINAKANPGVDVKNLTEDQAKQIYHDKYWVPSGAELLAPNLQTPYFDAYIRNPKMAEHALRQSGGDPTKFMQLSTAYFQNLAKGKGAPYAKAWANRDAENLAIATGQAPADVAAPAHTAAVASTERFPIVIPGKKDAPSGYQWSADGKALEAIPGGPSDPNGVKNQGPLKPQALEAATIAYAKTGKMPAGMGGQTVRNQILNYLPDVMDRYGLTPDDIPSIQQQFQADAKAYSQRTGQLSYMHQSLGKLNQHAQDMSALIKAVPAQSSFKPFNWITQGAEGQFSNSTITQLQAGIPLFQAEVARVMTGNPNSGGGQLSDDARHEFDVLGGTAGPKAKVDAINRLMKMTEEAVKATRDETMNLKRRIGGGLDVYAGSKPEPEATNQDEGWITLPSGLKIRKIH